MATIKPCPFCGGVEVAITSPANDPRWRFAYCRKCGAQAPEIRLNTLGVPRAEDWEAEARIRALGAWNTRVKLG